MCLLEMNQHALWKSLFKFFSLSFQNGLAMLSGAFASLSARTTTYGGDLGKGDAPYEILGSVSYVAHYSCSAIVIYQN